MIRDHFEYVAPPDPVSAVQILSDAKAEPHVLAGGTWLVPRMTSGAARPTLVIDLQRAGLNEIRDERDAVFIGAMATYQDVIASETVRSHAKPLALAAAAVTGGPQIRNRGTIGGSACYATPSSDVPTCLVALGATLRLLSGRGERRVTAEQFFVGPFLTALRPGELLIGVSVPHRDRTMSGFDKFTLCESSWPIANAACVFVVDAHNTVSSARLAVGAASARPYLVDLERSIQDQSLDRFASEVPSLARAALLEPWSDVLADAEYRKDLAGVVAKRAVLSALKHHEGISA